MSTSRDWVQNVTSLWAMAPANRRLADVADDLLHAVEAGMKRINRQKAGSADPSELLALTQAFVHAAQVGMLARGIRVAFSTGDEPLFDAANKHVAALLEWDRLEKPNENATG